MKNENNYKFVAIRPRLWEVVGENGTALGRIRHVFRPGKEKKLAWQAPDGGYYSKVEEAVQAIIEERKPTLMKV